MGHGKIRESDGISIKHGEVFEVGEMNDKTPYVCQYIVCTGGNDDPVGMSGMSHLVEHFLIHNTCDYDFFNTIKIHGFTSFYYTCYYWYVFTKEEAIQSFQEFEDAVNGIKKSVLKKEMFIGTKQEIMNEINYHSEANKELSKLLFLLQNDKLEIQLPIGVVKDVCEINHGDVVNYLESRYISSNTYQYIYNRKNKIFILNNNKLTKFSIGKSDINKLAIIDGKFPSKINFNNFKFLSYNHKLQNNSMKIILKNIFYNSILEIIIGEIFIMQLCDYLCTLKGFSENIKYEKLFIKKKELYFIITIINRSPSKYIQVIQKKELDINQLMHSIIDEKGFYTIIRSIKNSLKDFELSTVSEREIRLDLINYAALSYSSFNLADNIAGVVNILDKLHYNDYQSYIFYKVKLNNNESIKIIY